MADIKRVMISSTSLDLPLHRAQAQDACLRAGVYPAMMEHLSAVDSTAKAESLRLVNEADVYIGIFAYRYGYIPDGESISITQMEFDRAVERGIPRLLFLMDKSHPITIEDVDQGEKAEKLAALKERIKAERVVAFFKSPEELRGQVLHALTELKRQQPGTPASAGTELHFVSDIPAPPEPYIAHPYTLLQTKRLIGRQHERNLLTDWVANPRSEIYRSHVVSIVAIGGMGKSALTWSWFDEIAPQEMKPLAGRIWWSFYESDASFDNFVIRALAYVSKRSREEVAKLSRADREDQLFAILDHEPYLIVLDGLERLLVAYAHPDAARMRDDEVDAQIASRTGAKTNGQNDSGAHERNPTQLRKTVDPRIGRFLRRLASAHAARILISTRLYPIDLETATGEPISGSYRHDITGLRDDDALELWRAYGVTGSRNDLIAVSHTFGNHPLVLQILAGDVRKFRRAPGDYAAWRKANPNFKPAQQASIQSAMGHVLEFALKGLDRVDLAVLETLAAFRMPAAYDAVAALHIGDAEDKLRDEQELDVVLAELEERGLIGWDRRANRYDLHPIVRSVVWNRLTEADSRRLYGQLDRYFKTLPPVDEDQVESVDQLTGAIERYYALIGLGRYDAALLYYRNRLGYALHRLHAPRQDSEMLDCFVDGAGPTLRVKNSADQGYIHIYLAKAYLNLGRLDLAKAHYQRALEIAQRNGDHDSETKAMRGLADICRLKGQSYDFEATALRAVIVCRENWDRGEEAWGLLWIASACYNRGDLDNTITILIRARKLAQEQFDTIVESNICSSLAQVKWRAGDLEGARRDALTGASKAILSKQETHHIIASHILGIVALELGDLLTAETHLHGTLERARLAGDPYKETNSLIWLADYSLRLGRVPEARERLAEAQAIFASCSFVMQEALSYNLLARIERQEGNHAAAIAAATRAYELSWCDGPPYAYHWGLKEAEEHLLALGAPLPLMPPFDPSKYEPMPEVDLFLDEETEDGEDEEI